MRVLIGCESSGVVRDAFLARGHEVLSADLEPTERPGPHYRGDLFDVIDFPWDLAIVHIPCTDSSTSGARWFKDKKMDGRFYASNALWLNAWRRAGHIPKVVFEHPVSVISSLFRKPDQIIQPWQFWHLDEPGKGELKTTCLWTRGVPLLVPTTPDEPGRIQACWLMGPSDTRAIDRSRTYRGIADALAEQYGGNVIQRAVA